MAEQSPLSPWGTEPPPAGRKLPEFKIGRSPALALAGLFLVATLAYESFFTVNPTELAFTRTFGRVNQEPNAPVTPGVHLMIPFATIVDRIQISVDTVSLPEPLRVLSHDGQVIQLGVSLTRRIPPEAVYNLLYNTGGVGNIDIDRNIFAIVADGR